MTYTENAFNEQPAIKLFADLGWQTQDCYAETFGEQGLLGREARSDVVLVRELRQALQNINPGCTDEEIAQVLDEVCRDYSSMSAVEANKHCYGLIKHGVQVKSTAYASGDSNADEFKTLQLIDWHQSDNNRFLLCSQLWVIGDIETRRPDLIGFVNGLPLVFIELKAPNVKLIEAYQNNLADYKRTIPHLFWFNQLIILSNGVQNRVGSITSKWDHFAAWKKIKSEKEQGKLSLETAIRGTCAKERLLDIIENFILFETKEQTAKILAKYHQYLGVNETLAGLQHIEQRQGKLGVFWHTQGSGKSFSMVFFCQKAFRKYAGNWTFVIVTDREDLDSQIYSTFNNTGMVDQYSQARNSAELKQFLMEDRRFVFTLIHKFRTEQGESYPELSTRNNVIVITDEAHRSQYSTLALNMRTALPNAGFLAFTGTPLSNKQGKLDNDDARTFEVFGDYVSVYDFNTAIDDGATLPLYYENRVPEVGLNRDDLAEDIEAIIDDADLSDESEAILEREFARSYHIITRDDRLDTIAHDIVKHFMGREPFANNMRGKAMVVSIDKATAVRMYDKVQLAWQEKIKQLHVELDRAPIFDKERIQADIAYMESTDMAVIVSPAQNDEERMHRLGLNITQHHGRAKREELDKTFKRADSELRIVFVCAMWLTGFDAPCVSTLYLDKPLKSHNLMQTIARANRVYPGKEAGQIVDYINIFGALQEALGVYGSAQSQDQAVLVQEPLAPYNTPEANLALSAKNKSELRQASQDAILETQEFLQDAGVHSLRIMNAQLETLERQTLMQQAIETLMEPNVRDEFASHVRRINRLFKALLPDVEANKLLAERAFYNLLLVCIKNGMGEQIDDEDVLHVVRTQVNQLLDDAITTVQIKANLPEPVNIAELDFNALSEMLARTKQSTRADAERLKNLIELRITPMIEENPTRIDFQERFQAIVEQYNLGAYSAEEFFNKLKEFIEQLSHEDQRAAREGLKEPELTLFDLMCQNVALSDKERNKVKEVAKSLLEKLQQVLVLDWRTRQTTKARVLVTIEDVLQDLPDTYDDDLWSQVTNTVFMHVCDKYQQGARVY